MFGLQPTHLILILVIALIIFGPKQLPELGKALGRTIVEFKKSQKDIAEAMDDSAKAPSNPPANPPQPPASTNPPSSGA